jgi:hypothetical protein
MPRKNGTHTYDIVIDYHKCEKCGNIIESRKGYVYQLGKYIKEVQCDRCSHTMTLERPHPVSFAPLFE